MKPFLSIIALILLYLLLTFPVLGHHPPGCLCNDCWVGNEAERIEYHATKGDM